MKIVRLTAENVKRLKAVEITPDGTLQVISGRNAQGKTSVLDAIWLALGGGTAARSTPKPVRDGEDHASVTLDLGDLTVTRVWKGGKTTLTVTAADGAKYSGPQGVLDALVGQLSFDPLAFTRLSAREQRDALLDLVDLDVDLARLAEQRKEIFDQRTEVGRQRKALGDVPAPDPDVPAEEISAVDLIDEITRTAEKATRQEQESRQVAEAEQLVARLEGELEEARRRLRGARQAVAFHEPVNELLDGLRAQLAGVEDTNTRIRENAAVRRRAAERDELGDAYDVLTKQIADLDQVKADALAAAVFPVEGLGFDDDGVTYQGVPFAQASSAEQIRVSLAMAMSLNPTLRVIRILDGSLLDADSLALIQEMAAGRDYQVWIERVADGSGMGVVIEDGAVAS
ncbi:AAA family ATPase [Nocardioides sp. L-11A]|uniref:AAA family ATPase n=1 Tax=Nocardioides sp. L-11A TaxID=3043848 RepID=UPI00249A4AA1|nr:AAA family ATPase [Nocardioides sp. L-11A]